MSDSEIMADALAKHPECSYATVVNGMAFPFTLTRVVNLWRTVDCYIANEPPFAYEQGYPA